MPIRVARIITRLNVGGPAIQAMALSARLEPIGYHTLLIHGRLGAGEGDMQYLLPPGALCEVVNVEALRREIAPAADIAALARIAALLRRFRPAIVHTHMAKAGSLGRMAALVYNRSAGRNAPARIVHTYHGHVLDGYFGARTAGAFSTAERLLGRQSDALLAVSSAVRRDLLETHRVGDAGRFHVVPLGLDLDPFTAIEAQDRVSARAGFGLDRDAHVVSFVGRLTAIKQPDLFLTVAARIAQADDRARFLIAGGGELDAEVRAKTAALGLQDRVTFLGWQRDVAAIYAASDLVALTSRNEGTPVALIESMASAVPGVAFAVGGVPDVVASPDLGVLVGAGDTEAMTAAIADLLRDHGRRVDMGARARAHVRARFGLERLLRDIDGLYRRLL